MANRVGEIRPSQLLYSYGVGSVVELPNLSVMILGLDDWKVDVGESLIDEARLLAAVRRELGDQVKYLLTPPVSVTAPTPGPLGDSAGVGIPVAAFPRWLVCPACRLLAPIASGLYELKVDAWRPEKSCYVHTTCPKALKQTALPARFLVACENGHLDDFPWEQYVHQGAECKYLLSLVELGATGDVASVEVRCSTCQRRRRLAWAFGPAASAEVRACTGRLPHLADWSETACGSTQKAILLGASNSWFSLKLSALSIPRSSDPLGMVVENNLTALERCKSAESVDAMLPFLKGVGSFTAEQIWKAVEKRRSGTDSAEESSSLLEPEWDAFTTADPSRNTPDFALRRVDVPGGFAEQISAVVLVERLREVSALTGFTRIESPGDYADGWEIPPARRAWISRRKPEWVPAVEVRGEGIFIEVDRGRLASWAGTVGALDAMMHGAHVCWRELRGLPGASGYPGIEYVLLHSLSHALIRQIAIECGYAAASIRERIYSSPGGEGRAEMAGILLYTAASDSEGTLGGLVSLGEPDALSFHIGEALRAAELCGSDPLCAEHEPTEDGMALHAAACHSCLYLPETSCERGNRYLDRSVLVRTLEHAGRAFFGE